MDNCPVSLGQVLELEVERLAYQSGHGVARHQGFIIFVPWTAPLDLVRARVKELKAQHAIAEIIEILKPSPHRRTPSCPSSGQCGGCRWQQVTYAEQIRQKQGILAHQFRKFLGQDSKLLRPIVPSPSEFHYRNRVQLHKKGSAIGYFESGTQKLVEIEECWLAEEQLKEHIFDLHESRFQDGRYEIARQVNQEVVTLPARQGAAEGLFSQVNEAQNKNLLQIVKCELENYQPRRAFDFYAGDGNITRVLTQIWPESEIHAIELNSQLVERAQRERSLAKPKVQWSAMATEDYMSRMSGQDQDIFVFDPPRPGLDSAVRRRVLDLRPAHIVYVSCNPSTLIRDLETWLKEHYRINWVQGIDMFPQTAHLEVVCSLSRISFADSSSL